MQISNVLAGYSDPAAPGKRTEPAEGSGRPMLADLAAQAHPGSAPSAALRTILSSYDVADITPRDFSEMLQKLYELGAISDEEFKSLALVRLDLEQDDVDPDQEINLVDYYAAKLGRGQLFGEHLDPKASSTSESSEGAVRRRLDWMRKLALIQSAPEEIGLDIAA